MAKPDYPGLVLVPPSDRSLLRRRLAKWAFFLIAIIGGLSSLNIWFPSSHRTRDCQHGTATGSTHALRPDCPQTAQTIVDTPSPQLEVAVNTQATTNASKRVMLEKARAAKPVIATPSTKRPLEQPLAQYSTTHTTNPSSAYPGNSTSSRMVAASQANESSTSRTALQPGASQPSGQHKTALVSTASPANPWNDAYNRMVAPSQVTESSASRSALQHEASQPSAQHKTAQVSTASPANPWNDAYNRMVAPSQVTESSASRNALQHEASQASTNANSDTLLAEHGDAFAQYRLGRFFAQQNGSHSSESVNWYMKAFDGLRRLASNGNGKAMYVLGVMYAFGRGVTQNREEARTWLMQAMAHQVPAAAPVLASLEKNRPADSNPPMGVQTKRRQT